MARFRSDDWVGAQIDKAAEAREMVKVREAEECVATHGLRPNKEGYTPNFVSIERFDEVLRERDKLKAELEKYYPYTTSELGETIDKLEAERDRLKKELDEMSEDLISHREAALLARGRAMDLELDLTRMRADIDHVHNLAKDSRHCHNAPSGFTEKDVLLGTLVEIDLFLRGDLLRPAVKSPDAPASGEPKAEAPADLEPCLNPKCPHLSIGTKPMIVFQVIGGKRHYYASCGGCGMTGPKYKACCSDSKARQRARAAWNGLPRSKLVGDVVREYKKVWRDNDRLVERVRELIDGGNLLLWNYHSSVGSNWRKVQSEFDLFGEATK